MNKVIIMGRLSQNPETKTFDNGNSVTNFSVATDESYKNREGERVEQTEFHNICMYGSLGEAVAKYFKKGQRILLTGKLRTRNWEKDGTKHYTTEIIGDSFEFVEKAEKKEDSGEYNVAAVDDDSDDLPF